MEDGETLVPRDSVVYREFERLYRLAAALRPAPVDRWNGDLYARGNRNWGGFDPGTGRISLSGDLVLRHLRGSGFASTAYEQAQALTTILHEATHAGMETDAPTAPNAVRSIHSQNVMEGFAELRAQKDLRAFARRAGYGDLRPSQPQYPAPHAAVSELLEQASGPRMTKDHLLDRALLGPGVLHLDLLAEGVLRNRLADVVPSRAQDQRAVRAELITPMVHRLWPRIRDEPASIGLAVAYEIRQQLNATVDRIRQQYEPFTPPHSPPDTASRQSPGREVAEDNKLDGLPPPDPRSRVHRPDNVAPVSAERPKSGLSQPPTPQAQNGPEPQDGRGNELRFLDGQAPAAGAVARKPVLGKGERGSGGAWADDIASGAARAGLVAAEVRTLAFRR